MPHYFPARLIDVPSQCSKPGFSGALITSTGLTAFEAKWFGEQLRAAGEAPLPDAAVSAGREVYRFTWLRSFHAPIVVRAEARGGAWRLSAEKLSGRGGYRPGTVAEHIDRRLTQAERASLQAAEASATWRTEPDAPCGSLMADGAEWIVETVTPAGYRLLIRQSPESGPVRDFGLMLLKLTGWPLDPVY